MKSIKMRLVLTACLLAASPLFTVALYAQSVNYEMVRIPGGTFQMGSNDGSDFDESQPRTVTLTGFSIGKYEVTQAQYQAVMGYNPSEFKTDAASGETQNRRPVENVTWYDAIEFCNKLSTREGLQPIYSISYRTPETGYPITSATVTANWNNNGYRLPTEVQWECACRAGTTTPWHSGTETELGNYAWYDANSNDKTHEVGKKSPNAFGLYDMSGNVWEWCWDWYDGSRSDRVVRGGGWDNSAEFVRSAYRLSIDPSDRDGSLGFRLVRPYNAPQNSGATKGNDVTKVYYAASNLRLRSAPDTSKNNIIATIPQGGRVEVLETGKTVKIDGINAPWYRVKTTDGTTGWVFSGYLTASNVTAIDYSKILKGDLSDFAGYWKNGGGNRIQLRSDGTVNGQGLPTRFSRVDSLIYSSGGAYYAWTLDPGGVELYPIGVDIKQDDVWGRGIVPTDTTKDRLLLVGQERYPESNSVYYRE